MISFLVTALKVIFLLGFLIFIHEGGHFLVAKLCKVKVNEFAIGFGPTIWKSKNTKTKYALRLIPLGGFVSMEGEEERSEVEGSFSKTSIPKRIAIVIAGGLVNIIFGLLLYFILVANLGNFVSQVVETVDERYAAASAGIEVNDEIVKINNKRIRNKSDITEILEKNEEKEVTVTVKRNNELKDIKVLPSKVEVKDTDTYTYVLGVQFKIAEKNFINNLYYGFWDTVDFSLSIIDNLKMMFTGKVNVDQLVGPVGISGIVAQTKGIENFIYIVALISLSLGVTNLLPFPPLDGGKVVIYIIEGVRRKPLKETTEASIQMLGFAILIALSIYVTYNDILRIF